VDETFLDNVDELAKTLFSGDAIVEKTFFGQSVTASGYVDFILSYCKTFEDGRLPEIPSLLEVWIYRDIFQQI